jgi:uncharacterized protein
MVAANLYQRRHMAISLPILLVALAIAALIWQLFFPIARGHIVFSAGAPEGAYSRDAQRYAQWLERWGVSTEIIHSDGSLQNIERLTKGQANVAFAQGGFGYSGGNLSNASSANIRTIANVGVEHFWLFSSSRVRIESIAELRGLRIGVAGAGSGSRRLLQELLGLWRLEPKDYTLITLLPNQMDQALKDSSVDAVAQVAASSSPLIQKLLTQPDITTAYLKRTTAVYERLPYLRPHLVLRGSLTERKTQPEQDLNLMSVHTSLIVRDDMSDALQRLITHVAKQVHAAPDDFNPVSVFPNIQHLDFPSSAQARCVLDSGLPFWEQHLSYFWAQVLARLVLIVLPIVLIALWLCKAIPAVLRWRLESQINRWYGELRFIEHELENEQIAGIDVARSMAKLSALDAAMAHFKTPRNLLPRWHALRLHVNLVRQGLLHLRGR